MAIGACLCSCGGSQKEVYKDSTAPVKDRVEDLLKRMTLEEKVGQMNQFVGVEHIKANSAVMTEEELKNNTANAFYPGFTEKDIEKWTEEGLVGSFLHVLFAPGVTAISFESSLFREAQQTVDKLSRREQFTRTRQTLDSQAAARLLQQIPENSHRNSGRWQGENIYLFEKKADEKVATFSNDSTATAATTTSLSETTK